MSRVARPQSAEPSPTDQEHRMAVAAAPEDTLARWQAQEAEVRARQQAPGLGRPEQFAGKSGMQVFEAMLAGELPPQPITATLGFLLVDVTPGRAEFQGRPL